MSNRSAVFAALGAALLFGGSTPFAKSLTGEVLPLLLAGLLYLGSGIGLWVVLLIRDRGLAAARLPAGEWRWFLAAIAAGGILAPVLLMAGLTRTAATEASLMLNLEAVLTAVLAWVVFRENADRRIVLGMALIVAGGVVLAWPRTSAAPGHWLGVLGVASACLCWAVDNNLTRKVSAADAAFIAGTKGLVAGLSNLALALLLGAGLPSPGNMAGAMTVGFFGYGISLVLFVLALRGLGTARTGAYFSTAPFMGAVVAMTVFHEPASPAFWMASVLMAAGVWLHLTEHHEHAHQHAPLEHVHDHRHDSHHQHAHDFDWSGDEPHTHAHRHEPLKHRHAHYPDIHHQHGH